ncbi:MAG: WhiB family transcriptional regulator, partial [Nocardioidaceae bacterium]
GDLHRNGSSEGHRTAPWDVPAWTIDALCAQTGSDAFFPEAGASARPAKAVCGRCTVRAECLEYALANEETFGIWGGKTHKQRLALLKERGA